MSYIRVYAWHGMMEFFSFMLMLTAFLLLNWWLITILCRMSMPLIRGIKDLLNRNCLVNINHAYRETNFTVDFLADSLPICCIFSIYLLMGLTNGSIIIVLRFYTLVMFCLILGRHVYLP